MTRTISKILALAAASAAVTMLMPGVSRAADAPAITVGDQVVQDSVVVIPKVIAAQDGWVVIHAGDKNGTVMGYEAVKAGENDNVQVDVDLSKGTPTISAMLHIDAGTVGKYEFPGADVPVKDASGAVVNVPFKIIGVDVDDQFVKTSKEVDINDIVAQQDGWIVIHATDKDGTVLGYSAIKAGLNQNIKVDLSKADATKISEKLTAMIHIDAGTIGTYEFPGADVPPKLGNAIANEPLWTVDHVRVVDQTLADDGTLTVPYVLATQDGWIVIHATDKDGTVIGYSPVKAGLNEGVKVTITDKTKITDQVSAMLHIDAGTAGKYEFPGADVPVKGSDGKVVAPLFSTKGMAMMPPAPAATMSMGDMSATMAATPAATQKSS
jgi:hypothetical protein